jgi:hypothetical protein
MALTQDHVAPAHNAGCRFSLLARVIHDRGSAIASRYGLPDAPAEVYGLPGNLGLLEFSLARLGRYELPLAIPASMPYARVEQWRMLDVRLAVTATSSPLHRFDGVPRVVTSYSAFLVLEQLDQPGSAQKRIPFSGRVVSTHLRHCGHLVIIDGLSLPVLVDFAQTVTNGQRVEFTATPATTRLIAPGRSSDRLVLANARLVEDPDAPGETSRHGNHTAAPVPRTRKSSSKAATAAPASAASPPWTPRPRPGGSAAPL